MKSNTKINGEKYFYTWPEAEAFYYDWYPEIEDHINTYGSSHFVGAFSSYINNRSQKEDVSSIHSDMASMVYDIYQDQNAERCPKCNELLDQSGYSGVRCSSKKCDYWECL